MKSDNYVQTLWRSMLARLQVSTLAGLTIDEPTKHGLQIAFFNLIADPDIQPHALRPRMAGNEVVIDLRDEFVTAFCNAARTFVDGGGETFDFQTPVAWGMR